MRKTKDTSNLEKINEYFTKIDLEIFEKILNLQHEEMSSFPGLDDDERLWQKNARDTLSNTSKLLSTLENIFPEPDTI